MYANKDTKKGGEIELKASERKKIRKKNRKSSPYGSTDKRNSSHSLCTSETQTSLPYYAENFTEKTTDGTDHKCDQEDDTLNENDNQLTEGDGRTNQEEETQDGTYDNDNEISLNFKKSELEKEDSENSDVVEVIDSKEKDNSSTDAVIQNKATYSENTKNKSELEKENKNIKNSEITEAISSKIAVNSSQDGAVCVD